MAPIELFDHCCRGWKRYNHYVLQNQIRSNTFISNDNINPNPKIVSDKFQIVFKSKILSFLLGYMQSNEMKNE